MKLYTRWQVIIYTMAGVGLTLLVTWTAGILQVPRWGQSETSPPQADTMIDKMLESPSEPAPLTGQSVQFNGSISSDEANSIQIYEKLNEAVVNVTSVSIEYNWFLEPIPREGTGSGSIIDQKGYVLTNYHVVEEADQIKVGLQGGKIFKAVGVALPPTIREL